LLIKIYIGGGKGKGKGERGKGIDFNPKSKISPASITLPLDLEF
jgi:hypothetical protein